MTQRQAWDLAFDPATGRRIHQEEVTTGQILPDSKWPNFFSRLVAKLQWDAFGHRPRPRTPRRGRSSRTTRREQLTKLLAGFRVADDAVSENLTPFGPAAKNSLVAWVIFLQRRDEQRHARFFDRVADRGPRAPGDDARGAPRGRAGARAARHRRALRGAAARDVRRDGGWARAGLERRHRAVPHDPRGHGARGRAEARCSRTWRTAPCRASARACTTSSSTSAGTSASACAA